jgi:hypothetical protein
MDFVEIGWEVVKWIVLAQDRFQWRALNFLVERPLSSPEGLFFKATVHSYWPMKPSRMPLNNLVPVNTQHSAHPVRGYCRSAQAVLGLIGLELRCPPSMATALFMVLHCLSYSPWLEHLWQLACVVPWPGSSQRFLSRKTNAGGYRCLCPWALAPS